MKIEIILPDDSICGVLNYTCIGKKDAYMGNVILNGLEDGNIYNAAINSNGNQDETD